MDLPLQFNFIVLLSPKQDINVINSNICISIDPWYNTSGKNNNLNKAESMARRKCGKDVNLNSSQKIKANFRDNNAQLFSSSE